MRRPALWAGVICVAASVAAIAMVPLAPQTTRLLALAIAFAATTLLAYAVLCLVSREEPPLGSVLRSYDARRAGGDSAEGSGAMVETRLVRSAVELVERLAERRGVLAWVEGLLRRADLPFRPGEALFFSLAAIGLFAALALVMAPSPVIGVLLAAIGAALPATVVNTMGARRRKKFVNQLPGTLELLAGSLRAGYSLMQGVEAVSHEVEDPMGRELRRVTVEARLGRPLEEALDDAAERLGSPDFSWAVMAIRIQREVGGNLSQLLQTVAATMTERKRLKREVDALTAEGRISAVILGLLPVALAGVLFVMNRPYISVLFTESIGQLMLLGSTVLAVAGFAWMKRIMRIGV